MDAFKVKTVIKKDGEVKVTGIPFNKGQEVEMILLLESGKKSDGKKYKVKELLNSDVVGLWKDRNDIGDSSEYARKLRDMSQNRNYKK